MRNQASLSSGFPQSKTKMLFKAFDPLLIQVHSHCIWFKVPQNSGRERHDPLKEVGWPVVLGLTTFETVFQSIIGKPAREIEKKRDINREKK